jgi:hypothetical protein
MVSHWFEREAVSAVPRKQIVLLCLRSSFRMLFIRVGACCGGVHDVGVLWLGGRGSIILVSYPCGCTYRLRATRASGVAKRVWTGRQRLEAVRPTCSARTRRPMHVQGITTVHYSASAQGTQAEICARCNCYLSRRGLALRLSVDHRS